MLSLLFPNLKAAFDWSAGSYPSRKSLDDADESSIFICMRTTLNIDDDLLAEARASTGIQEKTALIRVALQRLVAAEASRRLAALGGTMPKLAIPPRRRAEPQ